MLKKILIYLPCHRDLADAILQARQLRADFDSHMLAPNSAKWEMEIVMSVNNFLPNEKLKHEAELFCNEVYYYGENLLADVNISEGFLIALRKNPDIFWILSANDDLVAGALSIILNQFEEDPNLDLLVASELSESRHLREREILQGGLSGLHLGLISGVIYRTLKMRPYFNVAPFFPWTGWSQLAVIYSAVLGEEYLSIKSIPRQNLFVLDKKDTGSIGTLYTHSYFGGLIHELLYKKSKIARRKIIWNFVYKNFYLHHLFNSRDKKYRGEALITSDHYLDWNRIIAESLIRSEAPITYYVYRLISQIPFEKCQKNRYLQKLRSYVRDIN